MKCANSPIVEKLIKACRYIEEREEIPTLRSVARYIHMSPTYFQKEFTKVLGVSPRQYADAKRYKRLREQLKSGNDIGRALYDAGFGASSRLYEFADKYLGMTPRAYKEGAKHKEIWFTVTVCQLGYLLVAATDKGICCVQIGNGKKEMIAQLKDEFPAAQINSVPEYLEKWTQALILYLQGRDKWPLLPYDIKASAFTRKVWDWLRTIPQGQTYNYSAVAKAIGNPKAARAVARACAANPVALVIPCHRIVPKAGGFGGYRWDPKRKEKLLQLEANR